MGKSKIGIWLSIIAILFVLVISITGVGVSASIVTILFLLLALSTIAFVSALLSKKGVLRTFLLIASIASLLYTIIGYFFANNIFD